MSMFIETATTRAPLLPDPARIDTANSIDEATNLVSTRLSPHRLKVHQKQPRGVAYLSALDLGDCALATLRYGFDVDIDAGCISDYFMVKWALAGQGYVTSGVRAASTSTDALVVTSVHERTAFRMTPECQHLTTRLLRRAVEERLEEKLGRRLGRPLEFDLEVAMASDFGRAWCQLITHICQLSATVPAVFAAEEVRKQYSRTLVELLLQAAPHNYSMALCEGRARCGPWHVRRAQEYIEGHISQIRSVADVAAFIGVTPRTLQNGFRQALGTTPAEYIRRERVQALHRALLAADAGRSVTDLMLGVGIANFGRYASYYRRQFGVAPSVTLRRTT